MTDLPLRPYQVEAIDLALDRGSLLLAMVMGAGKTRTVIEVIKALYEEEEVTSGIVFVPASLKYQWAEVEIAKWHDRSLVQVIDGTPAQRARQFTRAEHFLYNIVSYGMLVHDWNNVRRMPRDFIVGDEITAIKGATAKRSKRLKVLAQRAPYRFGLSGQPIENRPEELFSIMEFVDPDVLGSPERFDRTFIVRNPWGKVQRYRNLGLLRDTLGTAMYRRSREDIAEYLPKRVEVEHPVHLTGRELKLYEHITADLLGLIAQAALMGHGKFDLLSNYGRSHDANFNPLRGEIMARITAMSLLCSHPELLTRSAEDFDDEDTNTGSAYASLLKEQGLLEGLGSSDKLDLLMEMIDELFAEDYGNKVVIYSRFKPMVGLIGAKLRERKIGFTSMTGETKHQERQRRIDRFNNEDTCRVFVSSDAGAYGVNLDAGSHLFSYDLPWSAGALSQRTARIDRTSSKHDSIYVGYLFGAGTIEEYQYRVLVQKNLVAGAFIDGRGWDDRDGLTVTLSSLSQFLTGG